MPAMNPQYSLSRRDLLKTVGCGIGSLGLASVLAQASQPTPAVNSSVVARAGHHAARARRVIFLFMNGGPSHVDTFDPKPELARRAGQLAPANAGRRQGNILPSPFHFERHGRSGIAVSEIFPNVGACIDDIC